MSNEFLEYHNRWAADHSTTNGFGVPILRIKVGTLQFRVLDKTPTGRMVHYKSVGTKPVICPGEECLFCANGDEISSQLYLNIVDRADDKVKVLVYSKAAADAINELIQLVAKESGSTKNNHPENYDIQMTRTGSDRKTTRYKAVAVARDFSPESYKAVNLKEKLVPMAVEEQKTKQRNREAPAGTISGTSVQSWEGPPPSQVVKTPEVKTVISDDDTEEI